METKESVVHKDRGDMGKTQDPRASQFMVRRKSSRCRAEKTRFTAKNYMDFDSDSENEKDSKVCFSCDSIKTQKSNAKEDSDNYVRRLKPVKAMTDVSVPNKNKCKLRKPNIVMNEMIENEKELTADSEITERNKNRKKSEVILSHLGKEWILEEDSRATVVVLSPEIEAISLCANVHFFGVMFYFKMNQSIQSIIGLILIFLFVIFLINFFLH